MASAECGDGQASVERLNPDNTEEIVHMLQVRTGTFGKPAWTLHRQSVCWEDARIG